MQRWFDLSDPAMEETLYDVPLSREFAGFDGAMARLSDETTILGFRHLLEAHGIAAQILAVANEILSDKRLLLKVGSAVDATFIGAPRSTKNGSGSRDSEMQSTQRQFGYVKTQYRELARNAAQITKLLALSNRWMMRKVMHQKRYRSR